MNRQEYRLFNRTRIPLRSHRHTDEPPVRIITTADASRCTRGKSDGSRVDATDGRRFSVYSDMRSSYMLASARFIRTDGSSSILRRNDRSAINRIPWGKKPGGRHRGTKEICGDDAFVGRDKSKNRARDRTRAFDRTAERERDTVLTI